MALNRATKKAANDRAFKSELYQGSLPRRAPDHIDRPAPDVWRSNFLAKLRDNNLKQVAAPFDDNTRWEIEKKLWETSDGRPDENSSLDRPSTYDFLMKYTYSPQIGEDEKVNAMSARAKIFGEQPQQLPGANTGFPTSGVDTA